MSWRFESVQHRDDNGSIVQVGVDQSGDVSLIVQDERGQRVVSRFCIGAGGGSRLRPYTASRLRTALYGVARVLADSIAEDPSNGVFPETDGCRLAEVLGVEAAGATPKP